MKNLIKILTPLLLAALLLSACDALPNVTIDMGDEPPEEGAAEGAVEEAAQPEQPAEPQVEEAQPDVVVSEPIPGVEVCAPLASLATEHLALPAGITTQNFPADASGLNGPGCQVAASGTDAEVTDWGMRNSNLTAIMVQQGWAEDTMFSGAGAGGMISTFRKDGYVCRYISEVAPEDPSLCAADQPLTVCLDNLAPEQVIYSVSFDCTVDSYTPAAQAAPAQPPGEFIEAPRVQFGAGEVAWHTPGDLTAGSTIRFTLYALKGQQLSADLSTTPPNSAFLIIMGANGEVLLPDVAGMMHFTDYLPASQDYYVDVRSTIGDTLYYDLTLVIPPVTQGDAANQTQPSHPQATRIEYAQGATSWNRVGDLGAKETLTFVLFAQKGQTMNIKAITSETDGAVLNVWGADGATLTFDASNEWSATLASNQDYYFEVTSVVDKLQDYELQVSIQ